MGIASHFRKTSYIAAIMAATLTSVSAQGADFWVNKSGSDSHGCTDRTTDACLTIQKGISVLSAGDTLNIGSGLYTDVGSKSPYLKPDTPAYFQSYPTDVTSFNIVLDRSGTKDQPIVIQADPSNTEPVIVDGQYEYGSSSPTNRGGVFINYQDYVHIKNIELRNFLAEGIANWDHTGEVPSNSSLSIGVLIEGCAIHHVGGGDNDAAIAMWSTQDWVVRNNHIYDVYARPDIGRAGSGIQSFGTINALIEHNLIEKSSNGILWKDHYVKDAVTREPVFESEIRYNRIDAPGVGIQITIQGTGTGEAGVNYIHHNILTGAGSSEGSAILYNMAGASHPTTARQIISHNLMIGSNSSDSSAITLSGTADVELSGNIFHKFSRAILSRYVSDSRPVGIKSSDRNIFGAVSSSDLASGVALLDRYSTSSGYSSVSYGAISNWQAARGSDSLTLSMDTPDKNGIQASISSVINNYAAGDFTYTKTSPAIGLMSDGSNAGPYQFGNEVIGITSGAIKIGASAPMPPTELVVNVAIK